MRGISPYPRSGDALAQSVPDLPLDALRAVTSIVGAPLLEIVSQLRDAILPFLPHDALVVLTEDCAGRPQKKAGDRSIVDSVSIVEMAAIRSRIASGSVVDQATVGGVTRRVLAWQVSTSAVFVLCVSADQPVDDDAAAFALWLSEVAAHCIRQQAKDASPSNLASSRAAASERVRITAEMSERHVTDLESVLAVLRSQELDHQRARVVATDVAVSALIRARTASAVVVSVTEERVTAAFDRLRQDLQALERHGRLELQFVEPPADGRSLPGDVAYAARSIVRSAVIAMGEHDQASRVRIQWDCDGANLLVSIRDNGAGAVEEDASELRLARSKVAALGGSVRVQRLPQWGSEIDVVIPLDALGSPSDQAWELGPREQEVLGLLVRGLKNREIARELLISENTVKFHVTQIFRKLHVSSRAEAVAIAVRRI